jgi:trk system potassium uptake protein TrkA
MATVQRPDSIAHVPIHKLNLVTGHNLLCLAVHKLRVEADIIRHPRRRASDWRAEDTTPTADRIRAKIIERSRSRAEFAADNLTRTIVLNGDGMDMDLLAEAAIERADAVLVVTDDDKTNLLAAVRAKQAGCPMAIALVNDPTLAPLMGALDIDAYINPRATTVSSILRHIRHGKVRAVYSIGDAEAELVEAQVLATSPLAGKLVRDVDFPEGVLVGAVMKGDRVMKPAGDLRIEAGDVIALFTMAGDRPEVERLLQVSVDFF